ncbi:MAG TPA: DUF4178 domain-containing protein [Chthoniobacterales bacterium]
MRSYDCPSCGATLHFESSIAVSAVCAFCRSLVVRRDLDVETLGSLAQLPPDLSPLQIGTTGTLGGRGFRLAGRLRWQWAGGSWTEWFAEFAGGEGYGWLGESQGFYMLTTSTEVSDLQAVDQLEAGQQLNIAGRNWTVIDIKTATCVGGEGELPEAVSQGKARLAADLQGSGGAFASLEAVEDGAEFFVGRYARFADLNFGNLRAVPGWSPGAEGKRLEGVTTSFSCPNCAAPVELRAAGLTMSAVCGSCGTIIDTSDQRHQILETAKLRLSADRLDIPIGRRGTFRGTEYEVIGFVRRKDSYSTWSEYLLFNPWRGFDWLVTWGGHWSFVERMLQPPNEQGNAVSDGSRSFRLFARYEAAVSSALGEFYWQTSTSERTHVADYIAPPYVISKETYPDLAEVTWSRGEYVSGKEIERSFGLEDLQEPSGVYLNQPNPYRQKWSTLRLPLIAAIILLVALQLFFAATSPTREVFSGNYLFRKTDGERVLATDPFDLKGTGRVVVESDAAVANNWIGFDLALVDEATGKRFEQDIELEYYYGRDSDGSWSEGKPKDVASIGDVPPGRYRLVITSSADPNVTEMPFNIRVRSGGLFWSNFWMTLGLLLIFPLWNFFRAHSFEHERWSDSDFSP